MNGANQPVFTSFTVTIARAALYRALKEGWIAGAGLDVFKQEPTPTDNPLLKLDNIVVAPDISGGRHEKRLNMAEMIAENLMVFFEGKVSLNLVNPEVMKVRPFPKQFINGGSAWT